MGGGGGGGRGGCPPSSWSVAGFAAASDADCAVGNVDRDGGLLGGRGQQVDGEDGLAEGEGLLQEAGEGDKRPRGGLRLEGGRAEVQLATPPV